MKKRGEFQTAGYQVFCKPCPAAGYAHQACNKQDFFTILKLARQDFLKPKITLAKLTYAVSEPEIVSRICCTEMNITERMLDKNMDP